MKLAYLANIRFPSERAHAVQVAHMCQAFVAQGCEVDLFVSKREVKTSGSVADVYGFRESFVIRRLYPKRIYPKLWFTFYTSEFLLALHFLLKTRARYDVVYARSEWVALLLSCFVSPQKLVWESHEAKFNMAAKAILRRGVRTVVISAGIRDFYLQQHVPDSQLMVADDGIDESFFAAQADTTAVRAELGLLNDKSVAMYIGGLDVWKGVDTFLAAAAHCSQVCFVVVGGTTEAVAYYRSLYPAVTFLGVKPYKDLPRVQQAADVLVIPNTATNPLSSTYTSPLKLFAHMASGKPLVVTDIPSLTSVTGRELVTVCPPDDPVQMAVAITAVCTNYESNRHNATKLVAVAKQYTWQARAERIVSFIKANE